MYSNMNANMNLKKKIKKKKKLSDPKISPVGISSSLQRPWRIQRGVFQRGDLLTYIFLHLTCIFHTTRLWKISISHHMKRSLPKYGKNQRTKNYPNIWRVP